MVWRDFGRVTQSHLRRDLAKGVPSITSHFWLYRQLTSRSPRKTQYQLQDSDQNRKKNSSGHFETCHWQFLQDNRQSFWYWQGYCYFHSSGVSHRDRQDSRSVFSFPRNGRETGTAIKTFRVFCDCAIPQVLGAIGGTHIEILSPDTPSRIDYFSRKQKYTINTQQAVIGVNYVLRRMACQLVTQEAHTTLECWEIRHCFSSQSKGRFSPIRKTEYKIRWSGLYFLAMVHIHQQHGG